jgi:methylated-DNA-[protein]-cysteine S-methyltransferase
MTDDSYDAVLELPFARVGIVTQDGRLLRIDYLNRHHRPRTAGSRVAADATRQILRYLKSPGFVFDLPLDLRGTRFQKRVWKALAAIPAGEVRTYGGLARQLGTGARAIGNACRANPLPIIIPCHRVVAASGVGGYSGKTSGAALASKKRLLEHEGISTVAGQRAR